MTSKMNTVISDGTHSARTSPTQPTRSPKNQHLHTIKLLNPRNPLRITGRKNRLVPLQPQGHFRDSPPPSPDRNQANRTARDDRVTGFPKPGRQHHTQISIPARRIRIRKNANHQPTSIPRTVRRCLHHPALATANEGNTRPRQCMRNTKRTGLLFVRSLARTNDRHRLADRIGARLPLCQLGQHLLCFLLKLIVDVLQLHHRFQ